MSKVSNADEMFKSCGSLITIRTPRNLKLSVELQGSWQDVEGSVHTELPKERADSILIYRTDAGSSEGRLAAQKVKTLYFPSEWLKPPPSGGTFGIRN